MKISGATDIGNRRSQNQDKYVAGRLLNSVSFGFVCDGMGGVKGGDIASYTLAKYIEDAMFLHNEDKTFNVEKTVLSAVDDANSYIYNLGNKNPEYMGMGTTLAGITVVGNQCTVYHAGDSRVYILRDGKLALITRDHSVVQELLEKHEISVKEARNHPKRNLITRAVGVEKQIQLEIAEVELAQGDIILCTTDGLTNFITPLDIVEILSTDNVFSMPDKLIEKALSNNATDNITAVILSV